MIRSHGLLTHQTTGFGTGESLVPRLLWKTIALSRPGQPGIRNLLYRVGNACRAEKGRSDAQLPTRSAFRVTWDPLVNNKSSVDADHPVSDR